MCASALPGENEMHEIGVEKQKHVKNIHNFIDCDLTKDDQILIVFGTSIPDTTGHQMTVYKCPPHPSPVSALPAKIKTSKICFEMNQKRQ